MKNTRWLATALLVGALAACTDEKIVYRTREPFNPPPDGAFLGYFDTDTKQTTCGNCHVSVQTSWASTGHASAWSDLQASGHAGASCNGCHSVSELGNDAGQPAGYSVKPDSAYHDVQCESCHGAGFTHVQSPTAVNEPLASMKADTTGTNGCGACHTGSHEPYVDQWIQSAHGSGDAMSHATSASCTPCHEGQAAMVTKFGVTGNFAERGSAELQRITCVVCHDPHGGPNEGQLRASISTPTTDNLCVTCHSRKGTPPWGTAAVGGTARGSHAAQGLLVIGQNIGWFPPNFAYDTNLIVSSHGTTANPRLCATCHVAPVTVTDKLTGAFQFQSVGHLFDAIPCLDATGKPVPGSCAVTQRDFSACSNAGCHIGGPTTARAAYISVITNLNNLLNQLWNDANGNDTIEATDTGLLPAMVARGTAADSAALNFGSNVTTTAKGALFNAALAATDDKAYFLGGTVYGRGFSTHPASGNGVHNPFLLQALLAASIDAVRTEYGLPAPPHYDTHIVGTVPAGVRPRVSSQQASH
jgi:predicted CXXCH cytochrome family protein